jgi:hypothetical protein
MLYMIRRRTRTSEDRDELRRPSEAGRHWTFAMTCVSPSGSAMPRRPRRVWATYTRQTARCPLGYRQGLPDHLLCRWTTTTGIGSAAAESASLERVFRRLHDGRHAGHSR